MYELSNATATFEAEFMKKLSNTEAELLEKQKALLVKNRILRGQTFANQGFVKFRAEKLSRVKYLGFTRQTFKKRTQIREIRES